MTADGILKPVLIRMLDGRVGSTLLMQLLGTASEVAFDRVYPFEHSYLTYLARMAAVIDGAQPEERSSTELMQEFVFGDPGSVGAIPFHPVHDPAALSREALRGLWQGFSRVAAADGRRRLYAEKFWGEVGAVIDAGLDPVVVDLVRDPRDLIASMRAFRRKLGRDLFERDPSGSEEMRLRRTVTGMAFRLTAFATELPVQQLMIRYEDLISDLPRTAERLGELLGVELDATRAAQATPETSRHMTSGSATSSIGRWRAELSAEHVQIIETRLGKRMVELGYAVSGMAAERPPG